MTGVFINLVFLNQNFLVQKEVISSLRRVPGLCVIVLDITPAPAQEQAAYATKIFKEHSCSILFTINEWGLDCDGLIADFLGREKILHINWCVDDPFFEEIIHTRKFRKSDFRVDFVSDRDYLEKMKMRGYNAHYLPLGTDPSIFYPVQTSLSIDSSFVGSSYLAQVDEFASMAESFLAEMVPFLATLLSEYRRNNDIDIDKMLTEKVSEMNLPDGLHPDKAVFISKHLAGYLYRKETVLSLVRKFPGFRIYGDNGWLREMPPERLGKVVYGDGLREIYNSTKVNIDINRVVIRNGFTQRVFDALACGAFLITSAKPVVADHFETDGSQREIVTFKNADELADLVRYYLTHENERMEIARRGYRKVLTSHTYDHRIAEIFNTLSALY